MKNLGVPPSELKAHTFWVTPGEDYLVAAVYLGPCTPWFAVFDRLGGKRVPILVPSLLCEVIDARPSRLWCIGNDGGDGVLAPSFWADDPFFHGRISEGEDEPLRLIEEAESVMLREYPLTWISARAVAVGEGCWVADEDWDDTWEADPRDAMTIGPKTGKWFHNPLHRPSAG